MTANEQLASVGRNIQEKATLIWNVANTLFGAFKPHEYGLVILPMVVIKRFHDCLLPTHQAVLDTYKKVEHLAVKEGFLRTAAGYQFYNTSPFTFETLRADPENINDNFRAYLNGFSDNVQDILSRMNFSAQIDRMEEAGLLYQVIDESRLFTAPAQADSRSYMNVAFRTGDEGLDAKFIAQSVEGGFTNLKGHRSVGGMRASIYNAMPMEGVKKLVDFMKQFELQNG